MYLPRLYMERKLLEKIPSYIIMLSSSSGRGHDGRLYPCSSKPTCYNQLCIQNIPGQVSLSPFISDHSLNSSCEINLKIITLNFNMLNDNQMVLKPNFMWLVSSITWLQIFWTYSHDTTS